MQDHVSKMYIVHAQSYIPKLFYNTPKITRIKIIIRTNYGCPPLDQLILNKFSIYVKRNVIIINCIWGKRVNLETNGITAEFCTTKWSELSSSFRDDSITICAKQVTISYVAHPTKNFTMNNKVLNKWARNKFNEMR